MTTSGRHAGPVPSTEPLTEDVAALWAAWSAATDTLAQVSAEVGIGPTGGGTFGLAVTLKVALPALDEVTANALIARAHEVCPYSNATRGNIDVQLVLV